MKTRLSHIALLSSCLLLSSQLLAEPSAPSASPRPSPAAVST